jgi:hypothetical protein
MYAFLLLSRSYIRNRILRSLLKPLLNYKSEEDTPVRQIISKFCLGKWLDSLVEGSDNHEDLNSTTQKTRTNGYTLRRMQIPVSAS